MARLLKNFSYVAPIPFFSRQEPFQSSGQPFWTPVRCRRPPPRSGGASDATDEHETEAEARRRKQTFRSVRILSQKCRL